MTSIGTTLREARTRRELDLDEVEGRIKIRVRYLRALENEEWDVLPDGPYARSFIRTYANFLGLDGDRLADEFRPEAEAAPDERQTAIADPAVRIGLGGRRSTPRIGPRTVLALIAVALIAVLIVLGLTGGSGDQTTNPPPVAKHKRQKQQGKHQRKPVAGSPVALKLTAIADVWVCLVDRKGAKLVNGQILTAGADSGPFHSSKFDLRLGNGQIAMQVNGKPAQIASSSSPVGYEVSAKGVHTLPQSQQPTCA